MHRIIYLFKTTTEEFVHDNATQMAAALAYYAIFAIPSILLISINILSIFLQDEQVRLTLITQAQGVMGGSTSEILAFAIDHLHQYSNQGNIAQWIGIIALISAGIGAFGHVQVSLNTIWNIASHPTRSIFTTMQKRFTAILFIFIIGIFILVSFVVSTLFSKVGVNISELIGISPPILQTINTIATFFGITLCITLVYKLVPEGNMAWKDIFVGALVSSFLILFGKYIIGLAIQQSTFSTIYGAAGSLLILLLWVYYLSLIFFFGAEFTQVYSHLHGHGIRPGKGTISIHERMNEKKS
ncbi:MAG: YihY/virulence factor BrkB family protein [Candidatus Roizmanbacteria bacterium]|nr:YihY/virulence factor BrkB family protein [Candidatus Roizmanbacteria bacterium]